VSYKAT